MANPRLPGIPETEENLLYAKLNEYNRGRSSFKEVGSYLVVLPRPEKPNYSLWFFAPQLERQAIFYIHDLTPDVNESLRMASTMLYFSKRPLLLIAYNEKRMQGNGEDLVAFGKYRGHFLHEILLIDPSYLGWMAYNYTPHIPKQERFVEIAQAYHSVHLDLMLRKVRISAQKSQPLGAPGQRLTDLVLKVVKVKLEDDPYKTRVYRETPEFFVRQVLTLTDASGHLVTMSLPAKHPSMESCSLSAIDHAYQVEEIIYVASAHIAHAYEIHDATYTRLNRVKLSPVYHSIR
ncbi:MAG: hypothetical protein RR304_07825 [Bacteroides sp.]